MTNERKRAGGEPAGGLERRVAVAAVMALTIVAGVGVVLLFPRPRPASPLELARPAPVARAALPAWLPSPATRALVPPERPPAAEPTPAPPPLRSRRLAEAQVNRPHAVRPPAIPVHVAAPSRRPDACRAPASVADRLVCDRPGLTSLDRTMRRAYDRALSAGADRLAIDRAQARWRGQRDRATSEGELSRLYAERIAELDEAARQSARRRTYG
jgi:hypothetical protein